MPNRSIDELCRIGPYGGKKLICRLIFAAVFAAAAALGAQHMADGQSPPTLNATPAAGPATAAPTGQVPGQVPEPAGTQPAVATPNPVPELTQAPIGRPPSMSSPPIAIVAVDGSIPGAAISAGGAMQAWKGRAFFTGNGLITAGLAAAQVTLPYRGTLRVCPSTTVNLSVDAGAQAGEVAGLQMALDGGAIETSFAIARNSDVVLTPNFRILIGGPGSSEVKVRLGQGGDTCVDNSGDPGDGSSSQGGKSGANAPYVVVTSVFDSGLYRVQPGQRVMFEHGDLHTVVDDEKEPCGCPPPGQKANEFPLAESEGLAPILTQPPATATNQPAGSGSAATTLVYNAPEHAPQPVAIPQLPPAPPTAAQTSPVPANQTAQKQAGQKKPGFFRRVGRFFKRVFGAE